MLIRKNVSVAIAILVVLLGGSSCSKFQKIIKNEDWKFRYNAAMEYYEKKGDYYRAGVLLEDLVPIIRGTPEAEKAQFYWAYCYYKQGQYETSAAEFKKFHDTYNRSKFAEEALYMHCYSLYMSSPPIHLDQANTITAIDAFQDFINRYPNSSYAQQAAGAITTLRAKLETKAFKNAKLYQQLERYKAAVIAYDNFQKDFPDSRYQEEAAFRRIEAQYELAQNSYIDKKRERFTEVVKMYQAFVDKYPKSIFLRQAENIFENTQRQLKNVASIEAAMQKEREKAEKTAQK
ncbi:outer membrane protein assembly factor BamD [Rhodoflexus caldus]|uniref:outer membrane protein assembly factor BamD n=1 Tax=Rhodoflexus caldus TaxID=2891236 RepID=UPI002029BF35|nr:outer membrane protein assembly factor BamD [Rhodoflexus caldus]